MVARSVFVPNGVRAQLSALDEDTQLALEVHLENLEHFISAEGVNALKNRFISTEGDLFFSEVSGLRVYFSVDAHSRVIFVHRLGWGGSKPG